MKEAKHTEGLSKVPKKPKRVHHRPGKEKALIEAALEVFSEKGFETATTREIAERAGCAEGLIFRYFENKNGLFIRCLSFLANPDSETEPFKEILSIWQNPTDLEEALTETGAKLAEHFRQHAHIVKITMVRSVLDDRMEVLIHQLFLSPITRAIAQGLEKLKQISKIDSTVNSEASAEVIFHTVRGICFFRQIVHKDSREKVEEYCEEAVRLLSRGMKSRPHENTNF